MNWSFCMEEILPSAFAQSSAKHLGLYKRPQQNISLYRPHAQLIRI